jgi:hypothetical protein
MIQGYLLPGNEITGCPCCECSTVRAAFGCDYTYPCEETLQRNFIPTLSFIRYTTASERLAEGYVDGNRFIAYSSDRGDICFIQNVRKWELKCQDSFWNLNACFLDVNTNFTPAMCLRFLINELSRMHFTFSPAENILHHLIDDIEVIYLKALKDEVSHLEEYCL